MMAKKDFNQPLDDFYETLLCLEDSRSSLKDNDKEYIFSSFEDGCLNDDSYSDKDS